MSGVVFAWKNELSDFVRPIFGLIKLSEGLFG